MKDRGESFQSQISSILEKLPTTPQTQAQSVPLKTGEFMAGAQIDFNLFSNFTQDIGNTYSRSEQNIPQKDIYSIINQEIQNKDVALKQYTNSNTTTVNDK